MSEVETRGSGSDPASGDGAGPGLEALPSSKLRTWAEPLPRFLASLAAALAVLAIAILVLGSNPFKVAETIINSALRTSFGLGQTITVAGILTLTGLAAALPFRAGFWNVGGRASCTRARLER